MACVNDAGLMPVTAIQGAGSPRTPRRNSAIAVLRIGGDQPSHDDFDRQAYRQRNLVERLVGKLKQFRRIATRSDQLANHYLAFVQLASLMIWLRSFGNTTLIATRLVNPGARRSASNTAPMPPSDNGRTTS